MINTETGSHARVAESRLAASTGSLSVRIRALHRIAAREGFAVRDLDLEPGYQRVVFRSKNRKITLGAIAGSTGRWFCEVELLEELWTASGGRDDVTGALLLPSQRGVRSYVTRSRLTYLLRTEDGRAAMAPLEAFGELAGYFRERRALPPPDSRELVSGGPPDGAVGD